MTVDPWSIECRRLDEIEARTPQQWALRSLKDVADLAARHEELFPGDPVAALRHIRDRAADGMARVETAGGTRR
jgi:hypothetical protein